MKARNNSRSATNGSAAERSLSLRNAPNGNRTAIPGGFDPRTVRFEIIRTLTNRFLAAVTDTASRSASAALPSSADEWSTSQPARDVRLADARAPTGAAPGSAPDRAGQAPSYGTPADTSSRRSGSDRGKPGPPEAAGFQSSIASSDIHRVIDRIYSSIHAPTPKDEPSSISIPSAFSQFFK
jgi:hypothetical protein